MAAGAIGRFNAHFGEATEAGIYSIIPSGLQLQIFSTTLEKRRNAPGGRCESVTCSGLRDTHDNLLGKVSDRLTRT